MKTKTTPQEKKDIIQKAKELGVETDIEKRWENGIEHHPKSIELMEAVAEIDFQVCDDYFCWKLGGDGDNGETLMYEMDIYFEVLENNIHHALLSYDGKEF